MTETCIYGGDAGEPGRAEPQPQASRPAPSADTWAIKIDPPTYFRVRLEQHARRSHVHFTEIERLALYTTAVEAQFEIADLRLLAARLAQPTEPLPTVQP